MNTSLGPFAFIRVHVRPKIGSVGFDANRLTTPNPSLPDPAIEHPFATVYRETEISTSLGHSCSSVFMRPKIGSVRLDANLGHLRIPTSKRARLTRRVPPHGAKRKHAMGRWNP